MHKPGVSHGVGKLSRNLFRMSSTNSTTVVHISSYLSGVTIECFQYVEWNRCTPQKVTKNQLLFMMICSVCLPLFQKRTKYIHFLAANVSNYLHNLT